MFEKIDSKVQNPEIQNILKDIWLGVLRTRAMLVLTAASLAIALICVYMYTSETADQGTGTEAITATTNEHLPTNTTVETLVAPQDQLQPTRMPFTELEIPEPKRIQVPVVISHMNYNDLFEYLEYGNSIEFADNQDLTVGFSFQNDEVYFHHKEELSTPQFRAFIDAFPRAVTYEKEGYEVQVIVRGSQVLSQVTIVDSEGNVVWTPLMERQPRELNDLEKWSVNWATEMGYEDWIIEQWFDDCPIYGYEIGESGCFPEFMKWSPAEEEARGKAFYEYATDPQNNVWLEIWGAVDERYRWVDHESGEALAFAEETFDYDDHVTLYQYPESGWIELQIGVGENWDKPDKWEPRYIIKMEPGFVIGVDQMAYISRTTPLGRMDYDFMAEQTREWDTEKILDLLENIETN